MQTELLIDGGLVAGEGAVERILDPATGQCIAEIPEASSEMPHGGFKRSGYGKDLSAYALEDYTVPRRVMVKL